MEGAGDLAIAIYGPAAITMGTRPMPAEAQKFAELYRANSLLRALPGLVRAMKGQVLLDGRDVTALPAHAPNRSLRSNDYVRQR